jgi:hypothetical protein
VPGEIERLHADAGALEMDRLDLHLGRGVHEAEP